MKTIAQFFLLFAFTSLGFAADQTRESQTDDLREAVFQSQFEHIKPEIQVFFLEVGEKGGDPTDEFMKRFANQKPPVRKVSASSGREGEEVLDKKTGERGLIFHAENITWKSDNEVEMDGGFIRGKKSWTWGIHTIKKEEGKWKVTRFQVMSRTLFP